MDESALLERRLLGVVEVDSGTLLVCDPGYVLPFKGRDRAGVDYQTVIDAPSHAHATPLAGKPAILVQNFGGDGSYPVFGEFENGYLVRVIVEFVEPDDADQASEGEEAPET